MAPVALGQRCSTCVHNHLKVPTCEIFDRSDCHDFYTIKPFWVDDIGADI
jgi:hypothetical protein